MYVRQASKVTLDQEPAVVMLSLSLNAAPPSGHLAVHERVQPHGKKAVSKAYNAIVEMAARLGITVGARGRVVEEVGL